MRDGTRAISRASPRQDLEQLVSHAERLQLYTNLITSGLPLTRDASQEVVEYACHEGNYAIRNMLTGAAAQGR